MAWAWQEEGGQRWLVAVNYAANQSQCRVRIPFTDLGGRTVQLVDRMGSGRYQRAGDELKSQGLYLDLAPWRYHVFEVVPS